MQNAILVNVLNGNWWFASNVQLALVDSKEFERILIEMGDPDRSVTLSIKPNKLNHSVPMLQVIQGYSTREKLVGDECPYEGMFNGMRLEPGDLVPAPPVPENRNGLDGLPPDVADVVSAARRWLKWLGDEDVELWSEESAAVAHALWKLDGRTFKDEDE